MSISMARSSKRSQCAVVD